MEGVEKNQKQSRGNQIEQKMSHCKLLGRVIHQRTYHLAQQIDKRKK
jgi:hypothetical protein